MPHDSHTTHEPDRVGRESDEFLPDAVGQGDVSNQKTLLMFGGFDPLERGDVLAPAAN